ncbi:MULTISPECIES: hypothetical protein [unclassified Bradyrhizobium]|uniref:hypothetical protein n=1 Tax=unclassified Bradyrhizobium TaxID=2631580 RepID=UPI0024B1FAC4|nr:hypothetical protein [Bradyrhizobium sp. CB2312]WFU75023.1 hypothetical protein QA642_13830 [Bradyrhizobium sp. CB2312]
MNIDDCERPSMPIIRYFVFVGGLLLALLFAADRHLPAPKNKLEPSVDGDKIQLVGEVDEVRTAPAARWTAGSRVR